MIKTLNFYYNLLFHKDSYFKKYAILESQKKQQPLNSEGNPIPWMNYAVLDFFSDVLKDDLTLFEYGSGFSTRYFSERLKSIKSIEYDRFWFDKIQDQLNSKTNVTVKLYPLEEGYSEAIATESENTKYNLILIDGRERVECAKNAKNFLDENGILILDDSDRERYREIFDFYLEKGYKKITFTGMKPTGFRKYATTLFYKENNCLGI